MLLQMTSASRLKKPAAIFPLMAGGLGLSMLLVLGYRFYVNPFLMKRKREQAQNYADTLWDMQHGQKPEGEGES